MTKRFLMAAVIVFVIATSIHAQSSGFGVGIVLGEPTGISLKSWASENTAFDAGVAWGFGKSGAFHIHADYLIHSYDLIKISQGKMPVYYGIGGRIIFAGESHVGIRGVVGLDYMFETVPVDIFLELVPIFDLVPGTDISFNAGLGFRYFL